MLRGQGKHPSSLAKKDRLFADRPRLWLSLEKTAGKAKRDRSPTSDLDAMLFCFTHLQLDDLHEFFGGLGFGGVFQNS